MLICYMPSNLEEIERELICHLIPPAGDLGQSPDGGHWQFDMGEGALQTIQAGFHTGPPVHPSLKMTRER